MAAQVEFRLTVPVDEARQVIEAALAEQGFASQVTPTGSLDVSRGSLGTTLVAGALAGQDMHVRFDVDLVRSGTGTGTVAVLRSSAAGAFLKGGAIGASKASDAVREAAHRLGVRLAESGVLEGSAVCEGEFAPVVAEPGAGSAPPARTPTFGDGIPAPIDRENRTNVVAIVAIILGVVLPLGGIIAGAIALAQVKRTGEKGRGLAIAGIAIGSVLIAFLVAGTIALVTLGLLASTVDSEGARAPVPVPVEPVDPQPTDDPESIDIFSLAVGDCLDDVASDEVTDVGVLDCVQPHDYEVYTEFELPGEAFPGEDEVDALADQGCFDAFAPFVGLAYETSILDYTYFVPTQDSWESGDDRLVSCLIGDPGVQTSGSLAGAGR